MKVSVSWLQDFVKLSPPFERIADRLTMAGLEVKKIENLPGQKDMLFEIEITSNRPDWLSHLGVAREIAAVENLSLHIPEAETVPSRVMPQGWKITIKDLEACPYYSGVLIEGISNFDTPDFIKERLDACGIRSVNLIVDITNYVLMETGQPLHAFDADLIRGQEIRVRRAKAGEMFTAIDGRELKLQNDDLVIADEENALALAGVMGGKNTEVNEKTRNILLESAFFHPRFVRQSSRKHGLASESSYRFERRVDPEGVDFGRDRAIWLIKKYAKPRFISGIIKGGEKPVTFRGSIHITEDDVQRVLGVSIRSHQIASLLTRMGLHASSASSKSWKVRVPSFRSDLTRPIDLVEEIARLYGFEHIPESLPERAPLPIEPNLLLKLTDNLRASLSGLGLFETVTFSLISSKGLDQETDLQDAVKVNNPLNKELIWLRPTLLPSLLDVVKRNHHNGVPDVFIFEIANIYRKAGKGKHPQEEKMLSLMFSGNWRQKSWLDPERSVTFYDIKGVVLELLENLGIKTLSFKPKHRPFLRDLISEEIGMPSNPIGYLGEVQASLLAQWDIKQPVYFAEVSLPKLLEHCRWIKPLEDLPRYPSVSRDISLSVEEEIKAGQIIQDIRNLGSGLIQKVEIFDLFRGGRIPKGMKNLGFRITYLSKEKTLLSEEIQILHSSIAKKLAETYKASFQS